ncbi:hypothetical protein HZC07_02320 [Candidatus Micrarchaeota archaeon]|nr:hypothetical protein [Candidatus Micrarchaeota archaeon]
MSRRTIERSAVREEVLRRMIVPSAPSMRHALAVHADRMLAPTIRTVSVNDPQKIHVVPVFEEHGKPEFPPDFRGKSGDAPHRVHAPATGVTTVYLGVGKKGEFGREAARAFAAAAVRAAERCRSSSVSVSVPSDGIKDSSQTIVQEMVHAAILTAYRFNFSLRVPDSERPVPVSHLDFHTDCTSLDSAIQNGRIRGNSQNIARYLNDMRPPELGPSEYMLLLQAIASHSQLPFTVIDTSDPIYWSLNLGGVRAVAAGSKQPGYLVLMGTPALGPDSDVTTIVGKGITHDTGGYDIKVSNGGYGMFFDMSGSAAAMLTINALATLGISVPAIGIACIAQNLISETAYLPGQFIRIGDSMIEVKNTDAEGRLVLADGITLAAYLKPRRTITIATLTGAVVAALGKGMESGGFSWDPDAQKALFDAGELVGEPVVFFPTNRPHIDASNDTPVADTINVPSLDPGGHRGAAAFLNGFSFRMEDGKRVAVPLTHIDSAGMLHATGALANDQRYRGVGTSIGFGSTLLTEGLQRLSGL